MLGLMLCVLSTTLLATFFHPKSWVSQGNSLPLTDFEPTYMESIAPEIVSILWYSPSTGNGSYLLYHVNVGADMIVYSYGSPKFPTLVASWDPTVSDIPSVVRLSRFRFGWPLRALSYDDFTTGQSLGNPLVAAYHQKANSLAGSHRGLDRPSWLPGFIPLRRVPIAVDWAALFLNIVVWTVICYAILSIRPMLRAISARRRKKRGLCIRCTYPLEGLTRCPECGTDRA